jgi:hypothetical protein
VANSWGPVEHPVEHFSGRAVGEEGAVVQPHVNGGNAPRHAVDYNATDGRHGRESGMSPWDSVDVNSGVASDTDWSKTGSFPDGPGSWRQT